MTRVRVSRQIREQLETVILERSLCLVSFGPEVFRTTRAPTRIISEPSLGLERGFDISLSPTSVDWDHWLLIDRQRPAGVAACCTAI